MGCGTGQFARVTTQAALGVDQDERTLYRHTSHLLIV
jgi:hypothetical protein